MSKILKSFRDASPQKSPTIEKINQEIAVVGISCRFPGAESIEEFWQTLCEGRSCIKDLPSKNSSVRLFNNSPNKSGFLNDIDLFDPDFFSISHSDAIDIDPLTRQVLLLIPKLLTNAGYSIADVKGKRIGIFLGARSATYSEKFSKFNRNSVIGLGQNFIAAYAAQVFDFKGPNLVVDSACSSSLLSVHLACQSLKADECDLAIAGGVDLLLDDKPFELLKAAGALSTKGRCAFFDEDADGIALGEGVGLVLLKPHKASLADNNVIYAVIQGSAVNNDGKTMGITTPNPEMQEKVIRSAIQKANIDPKSICYIEAHGTGTMIGDPMELQALSKVFSKEIMGNAKIGVGSVKSNLGHLLSAAGIASLIKVVLILINKKIPASINCKKKNPRFIFENSAFNLIQELTQIKRDEEVSAGVSAFGFGGTNVHIILRESKNKAAKKPAEPIIYNLKSFWPKKNKNELHFDFDIDFENPLLTDHKVQDRPIIPGVTYLSWLCSKTEKEQALQNVIFEKPFTLEKYASANLKLTFHSNDRVKIISQRDDRQNESEHLTAKIIKSVIPNIPDLDLNQFKNSCDSVVNFSELYEYASSVGIVHGPFFKNAGQAYINKDQCLLEIHSPVNVRESNLPFETIFDPALLDGATFAFIALFFSEFKKIKDTYIPLTIDNVQFFGEPTPTNYALVQKNPGKNPIHHETYSHDIVIYNDSGKAIALFNNIVGKKIREEIPKTKKTDVKSDYKNHSSFSLFLINKIKKYLPNIEIYSLEENAKFYEMGLDSKDLLNVVKDLENEFAITLYPTLLFEYDTISSLESYLKTKVELSILDKPKTDIISAIPANDEPIAIIGLCGEFGPCSDLFSYWQTLKNGVDCIEPLSEQRLKLWGITAEQTKGYVGSWMQNIEEFEPGMFKLSPRELEGMDPQERKFLECAQGCLDDASYKSGELSSENKVGVFVGVMYGQYELFGQESLTDKSRIPNSSFASIANRVSYLMNWHGPSIAVDTMCSSSLTAIHLACMSLKQGECDVALAGGVNIHSHSQKFHWLQDTHFLSKNGRCKSFGQRLENEQDGYVPGEGVGTVLLKTLSKAIEDGDYIWAVIRGSSINHGGSTGGYTVPNSKAQQKVVESAIKCSGVDKNHISYIEAHGTGTTLGDPIEIRALQEVFHDVPQKISIGSVKSNLGHLESAAGIAGLAKILLQMHHKTLAPSLHCQPCNPHIDFNKTSFNVQKDLQPWIPFQGQLLTAGLSAFGAGGSNAHIILQEYTENKINKELTANNVKIKKKSYWVSRQSDNPKILEPKIEDSMRIYDVKWTGYHTTYTQRISKSRLHFSSKSRSLFGIEPISDLFELDESVENLITFLEVNEFSMHEHDKLLRFLFDSAKKLITLNLHLTWKVLIQTDYDYSLFQSLSGFLKTIHLEHKNLDTRIIFTDKNSLSLAFESIKQNQLEHPFCLKFENGICKALEISPLRISKDKISLLRKNGTYLVTGGLGGIGQVICQCLVTQWQANLCLIGRSSIDQEKQKVLQEWQNSGSKISYIQGDICDYNLVEKAIQACHEKVGPLNGIIHSAGLMRLCAFEKLNWSDFCLITDPKIKGVINLDKASANLSLDFFANFSSYSALLGITQGSDYSSANAFLMGFTEWRDNLVFQRQRNGTTIGFLWPRWKEGGLKASEAVVIGLEKWLWHEQGMRLLTNEVGVGSPKNCTLSIVRGM